MENSQTEEIIEQQEEIIEQLIQFRKELNITNNILKEVASNLASIKNNFGISIFFAIMSAWIVSGVFYLLTRRGS
jgi:hypothetical protein